MSSRNPLFEDLPLGTIITDEMYLQRLRDPSRFEQRKFNCPVCGERIEYAGSGWHYRPPAEVPHGEPAALTVYNFYCKGCNANVEYTKLVK